MRSLQARFNKTTLKNPIWSSYICFAEAITNQNFSRQTIHRWFNKLVERDDYTGSDKKAILKHLEDLSNAPRKTQNGGRFARRGASEQA